MKNVILNNVEHINISYMYEQFKKYVIYFHDDKHQTFHNLNYFLDDDNFDIIIKNERLKDYFDIFIEVNFYNLFYLSDYLTINKKISSMKSKYIEEVRKYNEYVFLHELINNIHPDNSNLLIESFFKGRIKELLIYKEMKFLENLKELNRIEVCRIFRHTKNLSNIEKILLSLKIPLINQYEEKFNNLIKTKLKENWLDVLVCRSDGMTLEEIGGILNLTRERIRQIESKAKKILIPYILELDEFLKILVNDKMLIKLKYLSSITNISNLLKYVHPNYLEKFDLISFSKNNIQLEVAYESFSNGSKYLYCEEKLRYINEIKISKNLDLSIETLEHIFKIVYKKIGTYFSREPLSLTERYEIILKNHFDDYEGLNISTIKDFKQRYIEVFDDYSISKRSDRAVFARAVDNKNVLLIGKGLYIYVNPDSDNISDELYEDIFEYIKIHETIYIEAIYINFYERLKSSTKSRFELHGKIKRRFPNLFYSKDYVSLYPNTKIDVNEILNEYLIEKNGLFEVDDFISSNEKVKGINMEQFIYENENLIPKFNKEYIHRDYIKITDEEINNLRIGIEQLFEKQPVVSGSQILSLMNVLTKEFVTRNKIKSNVFAYHLVKHYLDNNYYYKYPNIYINKENTDENLFYSSNKYVIDKVNRNDWIKITDIRNYANEININITNMKEYLEYFYANGYIRFDSDSLAKKNKVLTSSAKVILERVEYILFPLIDSLIKINLSELNFYDFPKGIKWNIHLLAHLLINLSEKIEVTTIGNQYNSLDYEIRRKNNE